MCRNAWKKVTSILLIIGLLTGTASVITGCGSKNDDVITLDVYSQLTTYSGKQIGWIADILKKKFNVQLNIIPDAEDVYKNRAEDGDLGDIVVWSNDNDKYPSAVKEKLLYDWNNEELLSKHGKYIKDHMAIALRKNQSLTSSITGGASDTLYGFGHNVATSSKDHATFFYTWDTRWDLYKKLGYPEIRNLDDYKVLMKKMQKLSPKGLSGKKTYAMSLWPDWDEAMVMYVKAAATAYYGYDELGIGLYDPQTGDYHDALQQNGPYLELLKFFNDLYQDKLLDPESRTQSYERMIEKLMDDRVLFSIFNYAGSQTYNKKKQMDDGKYMASVKPEEASPIVYGMNAQGGDHIWSIGAKTKYPELCMKVINYLCTPEGRLTTEYGPKGVCWDYDKQKNTYFTKLGRDCYENNDTMMRDGYKGKFSDGMLKISNSTWSIDASNPDSNEETYNCKSWKSNQEKSGCAMEQDWRTKRKATTVDELIERGNYVLSPGTSYTQSEKSDELKVTWEQVTKELVEGSWDAIYAKTDAEFDKIVSQMRKTCEKYGYEECVDWSANEAVRRKNLEDAVREE